MDKRFLTILAVVVVALGGIFYVGKKNSSTNTTSASSNAQPSNHTEGTSFKNINLTVFGDFECPVCGSYFPIEQQVLAKFKGEITFTFHNFPLESIHPNAFAASRAAEAAGLQGKFFEMHDLLYKNQNSWGSSSDPTGFFKLYATQLGLDQTKYDQDFKSSVVNDTINADIQLGNNKGVTGTPTYFLNGQKLNNSDINSVDKFESKIQSVIDSTK
jgi:protein-disulfide isomerase